MEWRSGGAVFILTPDACGSGGVLSMMLAADYEVMSRYALEDAERTANPELRAIYEAHARQWLELAAAASRPPGAIGDPSLDCAA